MAIKFHCHRCRQLLGIAARKAGSEIQCPKCGISQIVPNEEAASATLAMGQFSKVQGVVESVSDLVVYDDEPSAIETPQPAEAKAAEMPQQSAPSKSATVLPSGPTAPPQGQPGQPLPEGMILYPRRTIYVQGILLLVAVAVFFGAGYFIGRGDANYEKQGEEAEAAKERILVEGQIGYQPGPEQLAGDENAVIILLPEGKFPEKTISLRGIRPSHESPGENHKSVRTILELGGAYTRADAKGVFSMVVPDQGKYRLLIISAHARRPGGSEIDELDLSEMQDYFELAEHLIGSYQYRWTSEEINIGFNPIEVEFVQ